MRKAVIVSALSVILAAGFAVAAPPESAQAEASFAPSSLALHTPVNGWAAARLVVAGPEGFRVERTFLAGETVAVDFSRLKDANGDRVEVPDGRLKWELTLTAPIPGSTPQPESNDAPIQVWVSSGSFRVENGSMLAPPPEVREGTSAVGEANGPIGPVGALTQNLGGNYFLGNVSVNGNLCAGGTACTDGLNPGYDIEARDPVGAEISIHDSGTTDADTAKFQLFAEATSGVLWIQDVLHGKNAITIEEDGPSNALYLDSAGFLGVNNSTPAAEVHVKASLGIPDMWLEAGDGDKAGFLEGYEWFAVKTQAVGGNENEPLRIYNGAPSYIIDVKPTGDLVLGGAYTNYAQLTVGHTTATTNGLVAPMIVTTYSS
ncbi:MAG: hypothetical protein HY825_10065, partial [Acidobacteria bacterium]|nr:hypothetical protein [Acidobacteriota bacterium]